MNNHLFIPQIINYWFRDKPDFKRWFQEGSKYDSEIKTLFSSILKKAEKGHLENWSDTLDGYVAFIILTDQFSRHIYRDTEKAYSNDKIALQFMEKYLMKYIDHLSAIQLLFVLMPFQHSENLIDQEKGKEILEVLYKNENNVSEKKIINEALKHQKGHLEVIKKFGRFPKRNSHISSRKSTKDELQYIKDTKSFKLPY